MSTIEKSPNQLYEALAATDLKFVRLACKLGFCPQTLKLRITHPQGLDEETRDLLIKGLRETIIQINKIIEGL